MGFSLCQNLTFMRLLIQSLYQNAHLYYFILESTFKISTHYQLYLTLYLGSGNLFNYIQQLRNFEIQ